MVTEMYSGPCVAMEIQQTNPTMTFREFCGPADPVSFCLIYWSSLFYPLTKYLNGFLIPLVCSSKEIIQNEYMDTKFYSK